MYSFGRRAHSYVSSTAEYMYTHRHARTHTHTHWSEVYLVSVLLECVQTLASTAVPHLERLVTRAGQDRMDKCHQLAHQILPNPLLASPNPISTSTPCESPSIHSSACFRCSSSLCCHMCVCTYIRTYLLTIRWLSGKNSTPSTHDP